MWQPEWGTEGTSRTRSSLHLPGEAAENPGIVNINGLGADDIVIALMGPAGTGKSTFICSASGGGFGVRETLTYFTSQVTAVKFLDKESGRHVVLVDMPSVDDMFKLDLAISNTNSNWFLSSYGNKIFVAAILYLHRITDNRVARTSLKNLQVFQKLCGRNALDGVYLTTTMWDEVEPSVGEKRLETLKTEFWGYLLNQGAKIARCRCDNDSSKKLVRKIIVSEQPKKGTTLGGLLPHPPAKAYQGPPLQSQSVEKPSHMNIQPLQVAKGLGVVDVAVDDIVIAVMGPTGSGKSRFVYTASGGGKSGLDRSGSPANRVTAIRFWDQQSGRHVVLVDTPGLNDTFTCELDVLNMISDWLVSSFNEEKHLSGLLYFPPITDDRVASTPEKNLQVIQQLCGKDALHKLYLVTTMWDDIGLGLGEKKLEKLKTEYWKTMIDRGAQVVRCRIDDDSPKRLVFHIVMLATRSESMGGINPTATLGSSDLDPGTTSILSPACDAAFSNRLHSTNLPGSGASNTTSQSAAFDEDDVLIIVIGSTGVGKSSFVNAAAGLGRTDAVVGHGLRLQTRTVESFRCSHPDGHREVVLVDTPGFDDAYLSSTQILKMITNWLKQTYRKNIKLAGILYLHRITDVRMVGIPPKNLAVLKDLCGDDNLGNIVLVTTMWDLEDQSVGSKREEEIISKYWRDMIQLGSRTCRFQGTHESAWEIIGCLNLKSARQSRPLDIQRDMVDHRTPPQAKILLLRSTKQAWRRIRNFLASKARVAARFPSENYRRQDATIGSGDRSLGSTSTSGYHDPDQAESTFSGCTAHGVRETLSVTIQGLRLAYEMVNIASTHVLREVIGVVLQMAQMIERMGGTHHALGDVIEYAGWLLEEMAQHAEISMSEDMKNTLFFFQTELGNLENVVKAKSTRGTSARFLYDADIQVIAACITAMRAIYDKLEVRLAMDIPTDTTHLEDQLTELRNSQALRQCECWWLVSVEEPGESGQPCTSQSP